MTLSSVSLRYSVHSADYLMEFLVNVQVTVE